MIESPSNPTVKELQSLNLAKRRKERGLFLVEGVRLVEEGIRSGHWPQLCLYNEELIRRTERGKELLSALRNPRSRGDHRGPVQEATERAIAAATNTEHPQGVVAAFKIPRWDIPAATGSAPLALVCDNIQDPGNLGTIMRAAEAAGVAAVALSPQCADIYNPKVVRAGMGVHFRLPSFPDMAWENLAALLARFGISEERVFATEAGTGKPYDSIDWSLPSAVVISNEAHGLSAEARRLAGGGLLTIPMQGDTESLNAAIASAVILFEAARQRRNSG